MDATRGTPDAVCDGGDLDCGNGLLLIIRDAMAPLPSGGVLEVQSRENSVKKDLPAWCRLVGHRLLSCESTTVGAVSRHVFRIEKAEQDSLLAQDLEKARSFLWSVRVALTHKLQTRSFARNHSFTTSAPLGFDTADAAPTSLEYLLSAIASCLIAGFAWRAGRRGITLACAELALKGSLDNVHSFLGLSEDGHAGLARLSGTLYVDSEAEPAELQAIWQETLRRSPVLQSLQHPPSLELCLKRT